MIGCSSQECFRGVLLEMCCTMLHVKEQEHLLGLFICCNVCSDWCY